MAAFKTRFTSNLDSVRKDISEANEGQELSTNIGESLDALEQRLSELTKSNDSRLTAVNDKFKRS